MENDILTVNDHKYSVKLVSRDRKQILMEIRNESDNLCSKIVITKWEINIEKYNCDEISIALGVLSVHIYFNIINSNVKMSRNNKIVFIILVMALTISADLLETQYSNYSLIISILLIIFLTIFTIFSNVE